MSPATTLEPTPTPAGVGWPFPRRLGRVKGEPGPVVFVVGGMHGNEPAGAFAALDVIAALTERGTPLRGELVAVAGNRKALEADERFLAGDLNRRWTPARVAQVRAQDPAEDDAEDAEQREILAELDQAEARGPLGLVVLDLHTTSGGGPPFVIMSDTLRNRGIAFALPVTTILGLEETVDGTFLDYVAARGHVGLGVETGQHRDALARMLHRSVIWLTLIAAGVVREADVPDAEAHRAALRTASGGAPQVVELLCRHGVAPEDDFRMRPGYVGFQPIQKGEHLADNVRGPVRAPDHGLILMPLYQPQGSDGFFIVQAVKGSWLRLSALLRRLRAHWWLALLPGVRRHPERPHTLVVDPAIARVKVVQFFHLLGYRRQRQEAGRLVFERRV
ncbi:MAG: succinylglutamate desuccinylase/aspartoacylase family protein [Myxococcales bacterium]|nr:succinylglutamate desuccinylase/aspartoacylase family protein [Myxococcales bacterium]